MTLKTRVIFEISTSAAEGPERDWWVLGYDVVATERRDAEDGGAEWERQDRRVFDTWDEVNAYVRGRLGLEAEDAG